MGTDFIWRPTEDAVKVKDRTGFERYVKEHNEFFSENLVSTDEHRTTVKSTPDEEVVRKELFFCGFEIPYKDTDSPRLDYNRISHFDPRKPEIQDYLAGLSRYLDGMTEFLVLHEGFPEPYEKGLAWIVQMAEGKVQIIPMVLVPETKEQKG